MSWLSKGNSAMKKQSLKSSLHGFSMVEVMITLLVVSVALLSSVSLQVLSKRSNYDAAQRTTAAHLAEDLLAEDPDYLDIPAFLRRQAD